MAQSIGAIDVVEDGAAGLTPVSMSCRTAGTSSAAQTLLLFQSQLNDSRDSADGEAHASIAPSDASLSSLSHSNRSTGMNTSSSQHGHDGGGGGAGECILTTSSASMLSEKEILRLAALSGMKTSGKGSRPKKPKDMPRRPLSAYNIFFKEERARILAGGNDHEECSKQHRGPQGKIGFEKLAVTISKRWKSLPPDKLERYKAIAEENRARYKKELEAYHKDQDEKRRVSEEEERRERSRLERQDREKRQEGIKGEQDIVTQQQSVALEARLGELRRGRNVATEAEQETERVRAALEAERARSTDLERQLALWNSCAATPTTAAASSTSCASAAPSDVASEPFSRSYLKRMRLSASATTDCNSAQKGMERQQQERLPASLDLETVMLLRRHQQEQETQAALAQIYQQSANNAALLSLVQSAEVTPLERLRLLQGVDFSAPVASSLNSQNQGVVNQETASQLRILAFTTPPGFPYL